MTVRILVPVDSSATTAHTIAAIIAHRERFPDPLLLLHVIDVERFAYRMIPDFQREMIRQSALKAGEQLLRGLQLQLLEAGLQAEVRLESGAPRQLVCRIANDEAFDLLILGRRGSGEIRDVLFGTVANYALHNVRCPVLLF
ncbi:nucleotide-binding universal stress protein, UspA family [Desulfuromonas soudanensis]|uniref:Nucleotide-binding universal stress protein, UspA family n=1 Tax=Desulfuromonas soudanensis TaxID=1603606 RepID=A0A0M4CUG7_9BACT|nr:universal stress protein [Desulfuromonas soudanensis]ALC15154.1 nucleotide-binding universal stress protein, UspA family [Desulfuromonas soudanensis]